MLESTGLIKIYNLEVLRKLFNRLISRAPIKHLWSTANCVISVIK